MPFGRIPTVEDFERYRVTNQNYSNIVRQPLYDFNLYPGAGVQRLPFFQSQVGAGVTTALGGTVGATKSLQDTNMQLGGQLPSGLNFLAESIEVSFFAGTVSTASTYTTQSPVSRLATSALVQGAISDANTFYQSGLLEFNVLSTNWYRNTPLIEFVPQRSFDLQGFAASTTATIEVIGANLRPGGAPIELDPPIALFSACNFDITLLWPTVVALPSGFNARVGVKLQGYTNRAGQ